MLAIRNISICENVFHLSDGHVDGCQYEYVQTPCEIDEYSMRHVYDDNKKKKTKKERAKVLPR